MYWKASSQVASLQRGGYFFTTATSSSQVLAERISSGGGLGPVLISGLVTLSSLSTSWKAALPLGHRAPKLIGESVDPLLQIILSPTTYISMEQPMEQ